LISITANAAPEANLPPVVDAGDYPDPFLLVADGLANVQLNGAATDPDGDNSVLDVSWSLLSGLRKAKTSFAYENSLTGTFVTDRAGSYKLQLTVSDGLASSSNRTIVTVEKPPKNSDGEDSGCNPNSPKCTSPG
jgi:hypothetical protein